MFAWVLIFWRLRERERDRCKCPSPSLTGLGGKRLGGRGWEEEAGREEAGREEAGREEAGREEAGREEAGREEAGREEAGREEAGREEAGREISVDGSGFVAIGIRFENKAGKAGNQAVAFRQTGDNAAFYECEFIGWQDTLYAHAGRQYYRNCYVNGSVDFVFGNSAVVLDNCVIHIRSYSGGVITASGRTNYTENTGIVILNSEIQGDLVNKIFLGRPWKPYARVAVINTTISNVLNSTGWLDWVGTVYTTSTFIEQGNSGPGSVGPRIAWALPGIVTDPDQVAMYYPNNFLAPFSTIASLIPFSWL
ncbi:unnamed protein product [Closterium sp. NIES-53]